MIQPEPLKQKIQPLAQEHPSLSVPEQDYCRTYGIDFENQIDGVRHQFGYVDSCDYRIACHLYTREQSKGTCFVLHGYFDHTGLMSHIIRFFLEQDYDVLAFDLPGHGLSTGQPATIPDFSIYSLILDDLYNYSRKFLTHPCHIFGQSTGAAIITDFLSEKVRHHKPVIFDRVILSAPLVRPYLWQLSRLQLYLLRPFFRHIPRKFTHNSRDESFIQRAHNDLLTSRRLPVQWVSALDRWIRRIEASTIKIPVSPLIIQGTKDTTVDASHNIPLLQKLYLTPDLLWLENARHHLPNELKETRAQYSQWLQNKLR